MRNHLFQQRRVNETERVPLSYHVIRCEAERSDQWQPVKDIFLNFMNVIGHHQTTSTFLHLICLEITC